MFDKIWRESGLLLQNKLLKDRVASFESGEKFIRMQQEHQKELERKDRRITGLEKEVAQRNKNIIDIRNKWFQTCEDVLKEKDCALAAMEKKLHEMEDRMFAALRQLDGESAKLKLKNLELYEAKTQIEDLEGKLQELTARVNRDYTNSSTSSSLKPDHKKIQNGREKTGRSPGGQPGHIHHARKPQEPTRTVPIPAPAEYTDSSQYKPTGRMVRKQLIILKVSTEVVEYVTQEFRNQATGQRVHAAFPEGLRDEVNYDGSVKAAAYLLNNECYVSIDKTRAFLKEISAGKLDLSNGMICSLARQFSEKTKEERNQLFLELVSAPSLHADFTFGRMNGKQATVMISTAGNLVLYQGREKKGHEGVKGSPVEVYQGTIVSDHESTFQSYGTRHQECLVHVERYLRSSIENEAERKWNKEMLEWVQGAIHYWNGVQEGEEADEENVARLEARYDGILKKAKEEYEYEPPGEYFRDGYNLYKRMEKDREDYLLFLHDMSVNPTNNLAERAGRRFKRKAAQVMSFRSMDGVNYFCDGLSMIQTLKAKGKKLHEEIAARFNYGKEARE